MLRILIPSILGAVLSLSGFGAQAQSLPASPTKPNWCGTDAEQERYFNAHPGAREAQRLFNQQIETLGQNQPRGTAYVTDVTIPVVVHILHAGGPENISDRQINSAIDQLNLDYQKLNPDTVDIIPLFRPIAAAIGFRFRLAKKDPNGNCTTGITRHYEPTVSTDAGNGSVQAVGVWDQSRYLNIWVVKAISSGAAGYVSPPNVPTNARDGFVILSNYFGTQGTSNLFKGRAASHEIGHYFGLSHTWGSTNTPGSGSCTGTDNIADTPTTDGSTICNLSYAPCGQIANVQNYMEYSYCFRMFTQGQRAFMRNVLATNRSVLTSPVTLMSTGTNDGYVAPDCTPIAAFAPTSNASVCVNTPVSLRDFSSNFTATGGQLAYSWSFPGGTPATANTQAVSVTYPNAGFYSVTETVSNNVGGTSSTQTNLIRVEDATGGETAPYVESFDNSAFPNVYTTPTLRNYALSGTNAAGAAASNVWRQQSGLVAADGTGYLTAANRLFAAGAITTLVSPNINLAGVTGTAVLRFARAFALRNASSNEQLRVAFSADCGVTWSTPAVLDVTALSTQGLTPIDNYMPAARADWQTLNVPIPAQFQQSGLFKVRLQLVNGTSPGNNFYLDYLRVSAVLATKADALAGHGIALFPNPLTAETALHLALSTTTQVQVSLTDLLGRTVLTLPAKTYPTGQQTLALPMAGHPLPAGVYVVRIALNDETFSSKLTVE